MKIVLPAQINPPRLRKDGSASLVFDTRELTSEEIFTIMSLRHTEGWLTFSPNPDEVEIPEEKAELEGKTIGQRIRSALYVLYKHRTEKGEFTGMFETFYKEQGEKILDAIKKKID